MNRIAYSDDNLRVNLFKPIPRPSKVAFVGFDEWQINRGIARITSKYCRDVNLRSFNVDVFDSSKFRVVTNKAIAEVDGVLKEEPISSDVRLVVVDNKRFPIPESSFPISTIGVFINPPNPEIADVVFTTYPLFGRKLKSFVRSAVKSYKPLAEFFSSKQDIEFLVDNLYAGGTQLFLQELSKLQKLAIAFPIDFYLQAKSYISENLDTRLSKLNKLLRLGDQSTVEMLKFIYKSVFVDKVLDILQVFDVLARHFFICALVTYSKKYRRMFFFEGDNYVKKYIDKFVSYDYIYNGLAISCDFNWSGKALCLPPVPSIPVKLIACPGSAFCVGKEACSLAKLSCAMFGISLTTNNGCPLLTKGFQDAIRSRCGLVNNSHLYNLTSDSEVLTNNKKDVMVKPLGVRVISPNRLFSVKDTIRGISLFQHFDKTLKTKSSSVAESMSMFVLLLTYINKGKILDEARTMDMDSKF